MSTVQSNTQSLAGRQFSTILSAKSVYFVGVFKVPTAAIKPYAQQRPLSHSWISELKEQYLEKGIDRAAYPVKVILATNDVVPNLNLALEKIGPGKHPWLPKGVQVTVYEGQHRIAACNLLEDTSTHWWYAEVYRKEFPAQYPADILSIMFLSNEEIVMLTNSDADRFIAMYRLLELRNADKISAETYQANQKRLSRAISSEHVRIGLNNIIRSQVLCDAVAAAVLKPYLAPCFNASTWGKKLTKGRFYQLAACLVEEMTQQCSLLQEGRPEVSSKPFQLSPQSCSWERLRTAADKQSNHTWKELAGGIQGALERVLRRPEDFVTTLNPCGGDGWTLPDKVLLPSVLTSTPMEIVFGKLYTIAQHFIHMAAGPEYLQMYTSNLPHSSNYDHPAGIISTILGKTANGSNYPDKIILFMWRAKEQLIEDLCIVKIQAAADTTVDSYKELIRRSKEWWQLLRLLKGHRLSTGLALEIPRTFQGSKATSPGAASQELAESLALQGLGSQAQESFEDTTTNAPMVSALSDPREKATNLVTEHTPLRCLFATHMSSLSPTSVHQSVQSETGSPGPQAEANYSGSLKRRKRESAASTVDDYVAELLPQHATGTDSSPKRLRCHGAALSHLHELESYIPKMEAKEVRALDNLIQLVIGLQGSVHATRVFDGLANKIHSLTTRAKKAKLMSTLYDSEEENGDGEANRGHLNATSNQGAIEDKNEGDGGTDDIGSSDD